MPVTFRRRGFWGRAVSRILTGHPLQYLGQIPEIFDPGLIEGPSLFGQPLLPGTVVGEASMKAVHRATTSLRALVAGHK